MKKLIFALLPLMLVLGCAANHNTPDELSTSQEVSFTGTVVHVPLEGGFFGIVADNRQKYDPINLPPEFQRQDLPVRVRGTIQKAAVSFHMWGKKLEIIHITAQ